MKHIFIPISLSLLIGCSTIEYDQPVKDPIRVSISAIKGGVEYIKRSSIGVFALATDGKDYEYEICYQGDDDYTSCIERNKKTVVERCKQNHGKDCELVAVNDKIVYNGEIDILNKKFYRGDRINYFTVPALRNVDSYMENQTVDVDDLPDIFGDVYE